MIQRSYYFLTLYTVGCLLISGRVLNSYDRGEVRFNKTVYE